MRLVSILLSSFFLLKLGLIGSHKALGLLVVLHQRSAGRTHIGAGAALHAQRDLLFVKDCKALFLVVYLQSLSIGGGVEAQGAVLHAAAAMDTGCWLQGSGVCLVEGQDSVGALAMGCSME